MDMTTGRPASNGQSAHYGHIAFQIDDVKIHEKHRLRAFIDFTLIDICLRINGTMIHEKDGKRWVGMPNRKHTSERVKHWSPIVEFGSKESRWTIAGAASTAHDYYTAEGGARA